jgi:AAA domain, putative AbiEii toxin, Type IV TA system
MGLRVDPPERVLQKDGTILSMMVKDGDFVAEVGWMGHGLQMWLQTIWFISRTGTPGVVVLDEPDVYMHPDLQRKLFRLVNSRAEQSLIATHSVEIMAEADPSNILVLDKSKARSSYANSQPALQLLIDNIGGVHNVHLARLWNAKKFLLVEGDDIGLLRHFHAVLYPKAELPLDAVPNLPIDGWGGWAHAVGSSMTLHNAFGDEISTYCILDHDYHTEEEIELRVKEASQRRVELHIWQRKEIENYLLAPAVIQRVIRKRRPEGSIPSIDEIQNQILKFCDSERQNVVYGIAEVLLAQNRGLGIKAHKISEQRVRALWDDPAKRIAQAPGKTILGKLSDWSQATYGVSFGAPAIARHFRISEINDEIESVLESIETGHGF